MIDNNKFIDFLSNLTVLEMNNLVKEIEKRFEINTDDIVNKNKSDKEQETNEEKNEFDLILKEIGKNKISVIRIVRNILSLGLKEAKDLVESAPILLKEKINKTEAENIKNQLQEVGAIIEIN